MEGGGQEGHECITGAQGWKRTKFLSSLIRGQQKRPKTDKSKSSNIFILLRDMD